MVDRKRNLLSALGLAVVGTLLLVGYVRAAQGRAASDERLVPVVVTTDDVAQGASTDQLRGDLKVEQVPVSARTAGALTSLDDVAGRVPSTRLYRGEQVLAARLGRPTAVGTSLPTGMVSVALSLEPQRALGNRLQPGTLVDVLVSYDDPNRTETVLTKTLVQAVAKGGGGTFGKDITKLAAASGDTMLVTLAVPQDMTEHLVFAADHGRLWLAGTSRLAPVVAG